MAEELPAYLADKTTDDHEQALGLMDSAGGESLSYLNKERLTALFRAANLAVAQVYIYPSSAGKRFLEDYLTRADAYGAELGRRNHPTHRK